MRPLGRRTACSHPNADLGQRPFNERFATERRPWTACEQAPPAGAAGLRPWNPERNAVPHHRNARWWWLHVRPFSERRRGGGNLRLAAPAARSPAQSVAPPAASAREGRHSQRQPSQQSLPASAASPARPPCRRDPGSSVREQRDTAIPRSRSRHQDCEEAIAEICYVVILQPIVVGIGNRDRAAMARRGARGPQPPAPILSCIALLSSAPVPRGGERRGGILAESLPVNAGEVTEIREAEGESGRRDIGRVATGE